MRRHPRRQLRLRLFGEWAGAAGGQYDQRQRAVALPAAAELDLPGLVALLEACRGATLTDPERSEAAAFRRRLRPLDAGEARQGLEGARRRFGPGLHLSQYLQALEAQLVRTRTAAKKAATPKGPQP